LLAHLAAHGGPEPVFDVGGLEDFLAELRELGLAEEER
jgi:hypothetical protein